MGDGLRRNLKNVEGLTAALGERGPELLERLDRAVGQADSLMAELGTAARRINNGEGAIGRLVQDEEMYEQVLRILQNAEYVSKRLRPIIDDMRVLTSKVARDPALPIRDAHPQSRAWRFEDGHPVRRGEMGAAVGISGAKGK